MMSLTLYFLIPGIIAFAWKNWRRAYAVMIATILIDFDHVLASPIYDPAQCSIGFYLLHTQPAIALYAALVIPRKTRLVGVGLLVHMALDGLDCLV